MRKIKVYECRICFTRQHNPWFTDDISRNGPDHKFSMNPKTWQDMILRSRELERSLGGLNKKIEC